MKSVIILIGLVSLLSCATYAQTTGAAIEKFAEFPDGGDKLYEYVKKKMIYPADARQDSISGVVYVEFIVDVDGTVAPETVKVIKGLSPSCDAEAVKIIKAIPKWIPAATKSTAIRQWISFPVSFVFE